MVEPQPTKKPEWNTGGSNRTEPAAGEKVSGWVIDDQPPSSYFNWLQYYTYAWIDWLNERMYKGSVEHDLTINALSPDASGAGGDLILDAGDANTTGGGGYVLVRGGDGLGFPGGDLRLYGGNSNTGNGGGVDIDGGDATTSGVGGGVTIDGGTGIGSEGGDIQVTGGGSDTDGGDLLLIAGAGSGSAPGGNTDVRGGSSGSGAGGATSIRGGHSSTGAGGGVNIDGGNSSSGAGGDIDIEGGEGVNAEGGDVTITGGESNSDGGDVTITGGLNTSTGGGGTVTVVGGNATSGTGGNAYLNGGDVGTLGSGGLASVRGGNAAGANQNAGDGELSSGSSTGTGSADVVLKTAEPGVAGTGSNAPSTYVTLDGSLQRISAGRFVRIQDASNTVRGAMQLVAKAKPTGPSAGDIYPDTNADQLRYYDGTRYHGMSPNVYALQAASLAVDDTTSTEKTFQLSGPVDLKYTIPAGYLDVGSIIRIRAAFLRSGTPTDEPGFRIRIGSYSGPSGAIAAQVTANNSGSTLFEFSILSEIVVTNVSSSGAIIAANQSSATVTASTWWPDFSSLQDLTAGSIDFTGALDIFPSVLWYATGAGAQDMSCRQFSVDII